MNYLLCHKLIDFNIFEMYTNLSFTGGLYELFRGYI